MEMIEERLIMISPGGKKVIGGRRRVSNFLVHRSSITRELATTLSLRNLNLPVERKKQETRSKGTTGPLITGRCNETAFVSIRTGAFGGGSTPSGGESSVKIARDRRSNAAS